MPVLHQPVLVLDARAVLAEGPLWDPRAEVLWWTDLPRGELHRFDPASGEDTFTAYPAPLTAIALRAAGGLLLALGAEVVSVEQPGAEPSTVAKLPMPSEQHRLNDGRVDRHGRFWIGSMHSQERATSALHRIGTDGTAVQVLDGASISNGIDWSPDGTRAYYADSPTREVAVLDVADPQGPVRRIGTLAAISDAEPDGLTVDAEGGVWVALWGGHAVHRYLQDGTLDAVVPLPVAKVTSCTFGGPGLRTLYITTASRELTEAERAEQPLAGGLFSCEPGVAGLPAHSFGG